MTRFGFTFPFDGMPLHAHKDALHNYRLWAHRDPVSIQSLSEGYFPKEYSPGAPLTTDGAGFNAGERLTR